MARNFLLTTKVCHIFVGILLFMVTDSEPWEDSYSLTLLERWPNFACHKGWNDITGNNVLDDAAAQCKEITHNQKDKCHFKLCILRELGAVEAKAIPGQKNNNGQLFEYNFPHHTRLTGRYNIFNVIFTDAGGVEMTNVLGKSYIKYCTVLLNAARTHKNCNHEWWDKFFDCVDKTLGCYEGAPEEIEYDPAIVKKFG